MTFAPPTYEVPYDNELGRHGFSFTRALIVYILSDDSVHEVSLFDENLLTSIKAGSGEQGLALFRGDRTYSVTAGEQTLLEAAGYTIT